MVRPTGPRDPIAGPDAVGPPFPLKLRGPVIRGFGRGSRELGIPTANIPLSGLSVGGNENLESGIYYGLASLDFSTMPADPASSIDSMATQEPSSIAQVAAQAPAPVAGAPPPNPPLPSSNHAVADLETPSAIPPHPSSNQQPSKSSDTPPTHQIYQTVLSLGHNPYYSNPTRSIEIHLLSSFPTDFYGATLSLVILGWIRPEYDYESVEGLVADIREDIRVAKRSLDRAGYRRWEGDGWLRGEGAA